MVAMLKARCPCCGDKVDYEMVFCIGHCMKCEAQQDNYDPRHQEWLDDMRYEKAISNL